MRFSCHRALEPLRIKSMGVSCMLRSKTRSPALIRPPTLILRRLWGPRSRAPISTSLSAPL